MAKSIKGNAKYRGPDRESAMSRTEHRRLTSTAKSTRKLRKQSVEQDYGHVPIR